MRKLPHSVPCTRCKSNKCKLQTLYYADSNYPWDRVCEGCIEDYAIEQGWLAPKTEVLETREKEGDVEKEEEVRAILLIPAEAMNELHTYLLSSST